MTQSGKIRRFRLREMVSKAIEDGTPVKLKPSVK